MYSEPTHSDGGAKPGPAMLWIGGCYRSGTTLLEKLLHHHPDICIASQPFPDLYFYCKSLFYDTLQIQRRYPMEHMFRETDYSPESFHAFLEQTTLTRNNLDVVFDRMDRNKLGLWTPEILAHRNRIKPGCFWDVMNQLTAFGAEIFNKPNTRYRGSKEVLCEEYAPYLLKKGTRVILVIRDPRDMITSLNFKTRSNLTGENRPILYSLRIWRKSVAVALAFERHPGCMWVRYEDLSSKSIQVLNDIASFLDIDGFSERMYENGIYHQNGTLWKGNSSFADQEGVQRDSIGRFARMVPRDVIEYIEACCRPEMEILKYAFHMSPEFDEQAIRSFRDPFSGQHPAFPGEYSGTPERVEEEIKRYRNLRETLDESAAREWFIYESVYRRLAATLAN